ncbi:MAG: phage baseplate assembly protein V [Desulfobacteraceae bacterium]|nr:phage baseplate assembly protein V [Desulfobacteraceae bacterium]
MTSVNAEKGRVRVKFPDTDGIVSKELPVLFQKTKDNKDFDMPDVDEQVVCIFLANGMEQGFVIGSPYSNEDKPPVTDPDKTHYEFKDGTWFEYDRKEHVFTGVIKGTMNLTATEGINITTSVINITGDIEQQGSIHATGTIIDDSGNTNHHVC